MSFIFQKIFSRYIVIILNDWKLYFDSNYIFIQISRKFVSKNWIDINGMAPNRPHVIIWAKDDNVYIWVQWVISGHLLLSIYNAVVAMLTLTAMKVDPTLAQRRYCRPDVGPTLAQPTLLSG